MLQKQVMVVGSGLAGFSAAHRLIELGIKPILLEKHTECGGNSILANSGINAALTRSQTALGIGDSVESFMEDTVKSSFHDGGVHATELIKVINTMNCVCG